MTLIATEPASTQPEGRHRWPIIALAAAAVVAIVVGALMFADRDDSAPQSRPTPSPPMSPKPRRPTRRSLAASSMPTSPTTPTEPSPTSPRVPSQHVWGSTEEFRGEIAWNAATGIKMMINDCEPRDDDPQPASPCVADTTSTCWAPTTSGIGPYVDNYWDITIRDGEIVAAAYESPSFGQWNTEMWLPFQLWIKAEHPDDVLVLYTDETQGARRFTEEALQPGSNASRSTCRPC